jgi:hypothetical protein
MGSDQIAGLHAIKVPFVTIAIAPAQLIDRDVATTNVDNPCLLRAGIR